MPSAAEVREQQRDAWDRFSGGWEKWDHVVFPMLQPVGDEMIRMLGVAETAEHLDVASGTGEPALTIATIASRGRVVLTDLAAGMLDVARRNAASRDITNIEIRECSADDLPFPDASFDSISCRMGFMYFPDLPLAVDELRRVLRPGGKICVSVWAHPDGNPWATIPMGAIGTELELPTPPPDAPGLFRCAAPGAISALFESAGLRDMSEVDVRSELLVDSADEYWNFTTGVAAPLAGYSRRLRDYFARSADELGFLFVDATPAMQAAAAGNRRADLLYFPTNLHYTPAGHRVLADQIARSLSSARSAR